MPAEQQEVFISYKIGEARSEALRDALTRILQDAPYHLKVITDVGHLGMLEDLKEFMQRLARARYIIVILTPDYLASENCMYELSYMAQSGRLNERVFPIVYADVTIKDSASRLPYAEYWSERLALLRKRVNNMPAREVSKSTKNDLLKLESIVKGTQEALAVIAGMRFMGLAEGELLRADRIARYIREWISDTEKKKKQKVNVWRILIGLALAAAVLAPLTNFVGKWRVRAKATKSVVDSIRADSIKSALTKKLYIADSIRLSAVADSLRLSVLRDSLRIDSALRLKLAKPSKPQPASPPKNTQLHPDIKKLLHDMVFIEGGRFWMGSGISGNDDDNPSHEVRLSDFYIGKYEITQAQWLAVMGTNPSRFNNCPKCPVERVSWSDCQTFLNKLNTLTGHNFDLPTEAQWEYAARGGQPGKAYNFFYAGSDDVGESFWYEGNSDDKTHPVGGKVANTIGLYDMNGNVHEWCRDYYDKDFYRQFNSKAAVDPFSSNTREGIVIRGGSFADYPSDCSVYRRFHILADMRGSNLGFRIQRD